MRLCWVVVAALSACGLMAGDAHAGSYAGAPLRVDGLRVPARVAGSDLRLAVGGRFATRFWPGVNLGVTVPGHAPGELAPTRADYDRWLAGMGDMGVRVVRVYTILRPAFYDALAAYNRKHRRAPLYFIQGVWIPEEEFLATKDAYAIGAGFDREIGDAVAVVHGKARLKARRGHASGRYRSDVARWLLAWSPGVEWDPEAVENTDRVHAGAAPFSGRFVQSVAGATPMESWLAARLDHLATLEAKRGWSRPVTFTNWLTADPLAHPSEPDAAEDLVSVDAMHVRATDAWPGGFFASYHAYPYFPDFLRLEPAYASAPSGYAAYLRELRAHHAGQAVMITEFGVPSGLGAAHRGPQGRDQGDHSEPEAARIDAAMLREIRAAGFVGGVLFEWTDEWFKRTWNTQDLAQPVDRRVLWHNVLTNETQFGVVAVEPGKRALVDLDGRAREWSRAKRLGARVRVQHDAAYLYLLLRGTGTLSFDVRPAPGDEVRLTVGPGKKARLEQASWTDPLPALFGVPPRQGPWVTPQLLLSRTLRVPSTGQVLPPDTLDLGTLRWGGSDVRSLVAGRGDVVEVRIPWMLLGYADPSAHLVYDPVGPGPARTQRVGALGVSLNGAPVGRYAWSGWNRVSWHERRKAGWPILRRAFSGAAAG